MKTYRSKETGLYVGRQIDQVEGEEYEIVEVPTTSKDDMLTFLNQRKVDRQPSVTAPELDEQDKFFLTVRQSVMEGKVDLEEMLWNAPVGVCIKLGAIVWERTSEHYNKENKA